MQAPADRIAKRLDAPTLAAKPPGKVLRGLNGAPADRTARRI